MARRLIVEIVGDASSLQRALGSAAASTDSFGARMSSAGTKISAFGKTMTRDITLPIVGIGAVSAKAAVDFQNSMELLHTQAGVSQGAIDGLSASVLKLAGPVATAPDELSKGLYHLASQGLRGQHALDALKAAAEGAKMGQANLEDVTNALGAVIASNIRGTGDYNRTMGQLNATVGAGDMRMQDLADAMGTGVLTAAKQAGVGIQDVSAALAVFGDNNIRGAKAGTLLSSALRLMSSPSSTAAKHLGEFGINAQTLSDTLQSKGLVPALEYLKERIDALGPSSYKAKEALTQGFGGKQATGVRTLLEELDRLQTKEKQVGKGGESFASDWASYTKTTAYHLASMGAQMQATGVTIGDVLLPIVAQLADTVGSLAKKFEDLSPGTRKFILIAAGVLAALGPIVGVVGTLTTAIGGLATAFTFLAANPIVLLIAAIAAFAGAVAVAVLWPDKLRSVLEHMGLSAHAAGEIVDGLRDVFKAVETAGMALVNVVRSNWSTISAVIGGAVDIVRSIISAAVTVITGLWDTFGGTLTSAAETYWSYIKATIKNALEIIHGIVDVITGLIHGDWSKVWKGIEEIVSGTLSQIGNYLHTAITLLGDAAQLIGTAIWKGIIEPIIHLAEELLHKIEDGISSAIHEVVGWVGSLAAGIGHAIIHGILGGLGGLKDSVEGVVKSGLSWFHHPHLSGPPYEVARDEVGIPLARGIVEGYLLGIAPLTGKISSSVHAALEQAKAAIEQYRSQLSSSWSTLVADANTAFEGIQKAAGTMAGGLLASLTAAKNAADFKDAFAQAQAGLSSALSTAAAGTTDANGNAVQQPADVAAAFAKLQAAYAAVTAATQQYGAASKQAVDAQKQLIAATSAAQLAVNGEQPGAQQQNDQAVIGAQKTLNDLLFQQTQAALQKQDALEKKRLAARIAERKKSMDEQLKALRVHLEKIHATHQQAQEAIMKLLASYGVSYEAAGKALGEAFAAGLRKAIADAEKAAQDLAAAVAKYLPHSPAEKGPLSRPIGWSDYLMAGLAGSAAAATAALSAGLGAPSPAYGAGAARGGNVQITVNVPQGFVGSPTELVDALTQAFVRAGNSGHPYWKNLNRLS